MFESLRFRFLENRRSRREVLSKYVHTFENSKYVIKTPVLTIFLNLYKGIVPHDWNNNLPRKRGLDTKEKFKVSHTFQWIFLLFWGEIGRGLYSSVEGQTKREPRRSVLENVLPEDLNEEPRRQIVDPTELVYITSETRDHQSGHVTSIYKLSNSPMTVITLVQMFYGPSHTLFIVKENGKEGYTHTHIHTCTYTHTCTHTQTYSPRHPSTRPVCIHLYSPLYHFR